MKRISFKKVLIGLGIFLVVIQLFRIDKTNPSSDNKNDILVINNAPEVVGQLLTTACYDCHSNKSTYPWYTNIAPVSWWIKDHINEGRQKLNFSEWATYSAKKADHKLEECLEELDTDEMPLSSYTLIHKEASLSANQKKVLLEWFTSLRK